MDHGLQQCYDDVMQFHLRNQFYVEKPISDMSFHYDGMLKHVKTAHDESLRFTAFVLTNMAKHLEDDCKRVYDSRLLRSSLIIEETAELLDSMVFNDEVGMLDALSDLIYVVTGTAVTFDLPIAAGFAEVQRSNMTKEPRKPGDLRLRDKGTTYSPPQLRKILDDHRRKTQVERHYESTD